MLLEPRFDITIIRMHLKILDIFVLFVFSFWIQRLIQYRRRNVAGLPLPPGPPGLPLLGNRFPKTEAWLQSAKWAKIYGKSQSCRNSQRFQTIVQAALCT